MPAADYEKLGLFYLGKHFDLDKGTRLNDLVLYDSRDLLTHAVVVGMTGSGKTGLGITLIEEAAIDGIPVLAIDPKGDLGNLLLTFPNLATSDFAPWIDAGEAQRHNTTVDAYAAETAQRWKSGLAEWDQDGARIAKLKAAADVTVYTPGSRIGTSLAILGSLGPAVTEPGEEAQSDIATTASSLLGLAGLVDVQPHSREQALISAILASRPPSPPASAGQVPVADLRWLVQQIQRPAFDSIGVLDLETFFPARERQELALRFNSVLAAPGFDAWSAGEPLDAASLLFTPTGKPRIAIISVAHLDDAQRMLVVSLVLNAVLRWTRRQSGTSSLRALVYMDEVFGYLPPVANPSSKLPLLTLLKQARAFGVGLVLATQNPVDLDYKALSNAGTWLIGRLQTERDQQRLVDGLESVVSSAGGAFDREATSRRIGGLAKRQFLLHNVHDDRPEIFESRWAMSYLRGPLTRAQIKTLMADRKAVGGAAGASGAAGAAGAPAGDVRGGGASAPQVPTPPISTPAVSAQWVLPPGIPQYFAPAPAGSTYEPMILGSADVRFADTKKGIDEMRQVSLVTPLTSEAIPVSWERARPADFDPSHLETELPQGAFRELPGAASKAKNYADWTKGFVSWLSSNETLDIYKSPSLGLVSNAGEREGDFRVRLQQAARERRDAEVTRLRQKYAPKVAQFQERLRRAQQSVEKEQQQSSEQKTQAAISIGASVLGALFGRKTLSASNVGRATTAARGMGRIARESQDIARAQQNVAAIQEQLSELEASVQAEIAGLDATYHPQTEPLDTVSLKPKRAGTQIKLVALVWVPA